MRLNSNSTELAGQANRANEEKDRHWISAHKKGTTEEWQEEKEKHRSEELRRDDK